MLHITGAIATASVLEVIQSAGAVPNNHIKVSIPINIGKGGGAERTHIKAIKGVVTTGLLHITGASATAGVLEVIQSAESFPDKRIEVSIPINVCKGGGAHNTLLNAIKGVVTTGLFHITGAVATASVLQVRQSAIVLPDNRIKVSIPINVCKGGGAI